MFPQYNEQLKIKGIVRTGTNIKGTISSNKLKTKIVGEDDRLKIKGTIRTGANIKGNISNNNILKAQIIGSVADYPNYDGEYEIIPKTTSQTLETKNKITREDIKVKEIPYSETPNVYGRTISIA